MPLAVLINQATKLPLRQFQLEQCKCRVGERAGFNEMKDPCLHAARLRAHARARPRDHVGHQSRRDRSGAMNLLLQVAQVPPVVRVERHGICPK
jgi:hypothetical protein